MILFHLLIPHAAVTYGVVHSLTQCSWLARGSGSLAAVHHGVVIFGDRICTCDGIQQADVKVAMPYLRDNRSPTKLSCGLLETYFTNLFYPFGSNDKPIWGWSYEVERIAGDQGEHLILARSQHTDIVWPHYLSGHHAITVFTAQCFQGDDVVLPDIMQRPEKRVAMSGNSNIPRLPRQSHSSNVANRAPQGGSIGSFHYNRRKAQARDFNAADQTVDRGWQRILC